MLADAGRAEAAELHPPPPVDKSSVHHAHHVCMRKLQALH